MSRETVTISKNILNWINDRYIDNLGSIRSRFQSWLDGSKLPTVSQAISLFNKLNLPLRYLFMDSVPNEKLDFIEFRTINSAELSDPSRELNDVYINMVQIKDWMSEYSKMNYLESLQFVGSCSRESNKYDIANRIMDTMSFSHEDLNNINSARELFKFIRSKCEKLGIIVMMNGIVGSNTHRKLNIKEFRAFTLIDSFAPLIFINSADSYNGRLFSLFHEIAHVFLGTNSLYNRLDKDNVDVRHDEALCNSIAAEILVPDEYIKRRFENLSTEIKSMANILEKFKNEVHGSEYVILRKLYDNHILSIDAYRELLEDYQDRYERIIGTRKATNGGNSNVLLQSRIDNRLAMALNSSAESGYTSFVDVYRMTYTNERSFSKLINQIKNK